MNRNISMAAVLCATLLSACEKNAVQDITGTLPGASIKFFNFAVNAPGVNFYAGDRKITAVTSATGTESVTGTVYGGVGAGGFYSAIAPGQHTLAGRIAAAADKDLAISSVAATIADGKQYSFYQSGFYSTSTKSADAFIVEDNFIATLDYTVAYIRFVNAISNASPMTLFASNTTTAVEVPIGGAVAYKTAGAFTAVPNGVYNLSTRVAGSATNAITRSAVSFVAGRVYTIGSRGDMTVVSTSAVNRPFLDNTLNR